MVGEGVRSGSSPGERKGRHARPGKTRNEQLIDRAWENSCQRARTRTAHATSTRSNRISRDRQYASLCHQTVFVEFVRTRAVCREQTVNGEKRPRADLQDRANFIANHPQKTASAPARSKLNQYRRGSVIRPYFATQLRSSAKPSCHWSSSGTQPAATNKPADTQRSVLIACVTARAAQSMPETKSKPVAPKYRMYDRPRTLCWLVVILWLDRPFLATLRRFS